MGNEVGKGLKGRRGEKGGWRRKETGRRKLEEKTGEERSREGRRREDPLWESDGAYPRLMM